VVRWCKRHFHQPQNNISSASRERRAKHHSKDLFQLREIEASGSTKPLGLMSQTDSEVRRQAKELDPGLVGMRGWLGMERVEVGNKGIDVVGEHRG
jgi:hypothetical protein